MRVGRSGVGRNAGGRQGEQVFEQVQTEEEGRGRGFIVGECMDHLHAGSKSRGRAAGEVLGACKLSSSESEAGYDDVAMLTMSRSVVIKNVIRVRPGLDELRLVAQMLT